MIRIFATTFAALLGLAFGSFLNVCLSRWPDGESVVRPRSHCRSCLHQLAWWENVPLLSWCMLKARCRCCHSRIPARYPVVELIVGVLWGLAAWQIPYEEIVEQIIRGTDLPLAAVGPNLLMAVGAMIFYWLLVALALFDAEHLWLPDKLVLPGIVLGVGFQIVHSTTFGQTAFHSQRVDWHSLLIALLGILVSAGLVLLIRWVYWLIRHQEGIGLGDAKLMALLAAWLGLPGALLSFGIGVLLGSLVALALLPGSLRKRSAPETKKMDAEKMRTGEMGAEEMKIRETDSADPNEETGQTTEPPPWALIQLPLGTFLCIGGVVSQVAGREIIAAYLRWAGL